MGQFSLGTPNSHWGYGSAGPYSPYLTGSGLSSCATPSAAQFNNPALGFTCTTDQTATQDFTTSRECVPSKLMTILYLTLSIIIWLTTIILKFVCVVLPDSTATDLDQHLSNLVGTPPSSQMPHQNLIAGTTTQTTPIPTTPSNGSNGLNLNTRYQSNNSANDYTNVHSSQNGPRSLSDSSQTDSPVQDDLLTTNTPNLGSTGNQNFSGIVVNQSQNSYGTSGASGCNGSLYPVLPASLLYSQLYTAANQTHTFHSLQSSQNSVHGELQTVMDHISTTGVVGNSGGRHQQNLMGAGHTDLSLVGGNCGANARGNGEEGGNRQVALGQRGQPHGPNDNGNSVWRPY